MLSSNLLRSVSPSLARIFSCPTAAAARGLASKATKEIYAPEVAKDINWVGAIDQNVRHFHGYKTSCGSSYNAYLFKGGNGETVLVDTVKKDFSHELLEKIDSLTDKVDHVIINHGEPDHSSSLPAVMEAFPQAMVHTNKSCMGTLNRYFGGDNWNVNIVKDGEELDFGGRRAVYYTTPLVHWPDSALTYLPDEKVVFSMDAFGQHIASHHRYVDGNLEYTHDKVMYESKAYYANIIAGLNNKVKKICAKKLSKLDIETILPAHGLIWNNPGPIVENYVKWASGKMDPKLCIIYDTMWGSSDKMAKAIAEGAMTYANSLTPECSSESVLDIKLLCVHDQATHITELATECLEASGLVIGSSTLNGQYMPELAMSLNYIGGLGMAKDRVCASFSTFGWEEDAVVDQINEWFTKNKAKEVIHGPSAQFKATAAELHECRLLGAEMAGKAIRNASA